MHRTCRVAGNLRPLHRRDQTHAKPDSCHVRLLQPHVFRASRDRVSRATPDKSGAALIAVEPQESDCELIAVKSSPHLTGRHRRLALEATLGLSRRHGALR
jgi:hypothetical protein